MNIIRTLASTSRSAGTQGRRRIDAARGRDTAGEGRRLVAVGLTGAATGYAIAYLFDPSRGRGRRARIADQAAAVLRRGVRRAERSSRIAASMARGKLEALRVSSDAERAYMNDAELAHAVETELFRDAKVDKGRININVENGLVVLRGEAKTDAERQRLAKRVSGMAGVWSVRNLLHLAGEPIPEEAGIAG